MHYTTQLYADNCFVCPRKIILILLILAVGREKDCDCSLLFKQFVCSIRVFCIINGQVKSDLLHGLVLNPRKVVFMVFGTASSIAEVRAQSPEITVGGVKIPRSREAKYLGVWLTEDPTWGR